MKSILETLKMRNDFIDSKIAAFSILILFTISEGLEAVIDSMGWVTIPDSSG
ncbi:MAG TPA: hypothetical protein VFR94_24310 [Nitrososphaeraceae archaeon]|nr:hypothetical protein [Nitrososphaeraceae archaeon]